MLTTRAPVLLTLALLTAGCYAGSAALSEGTHDTDSTDGTDGTGPGGGASTPTDAADTDGSGDPTGADTDDPTGGAPAVCEPLRSPLRRLSRTELTNTLADLFPGVTLPELDLPVDKPKDLFANAVDTQEPTDVYVESHWRATVVVADAIVADLPGVMGCALTDDAARQACADAYVPALLRRAYRRPVTQAELDRHLADFLPTQWATHGFDTAMKLLITAVLNSPSFLYRAELGLADADPTATMPLRPEELATRLSYFLWQTMPDDALTLAAESGLLGTPAGLEAEARRLLADPRARTTVADFHRQWLALDRLDAIERDTTVFPTWTPSSRR